MLKLPSSQKNKLVNFGYNYLKDIYSKGIIQLRKSYDIQEFSQVLLKSESLAQRRDISDFYTVNSAANKIQQLSGTEYKFLVPLLLAAVEQNILFDKLATDELLSSELSNISTTKGLVVSGQVIINKGELVDAQKYQVLLSLKQKYEGAVWEKSSYLLVLFGQFILVGISLLMLWLFCMIIFRHGFALLKCDYPGKGVLFFPPSLFFRRLLCVRPPSSCPFCAGVFMHAFLR